MVLKPDTAAKEAKEFLPACDIVLLMTVEPGFGGQSFRHDVLPKIEQFDTWRAEMGLNYRLEIDGGVDLETAPLCTALGADTIVAGTAFFKSADPSVFVAAVKA